MSTSDASTIAELTRILKNPKDFYKILNVSKDCSDADVKKGTNLYQYYRYY